MTTNNEEPINTHKDDRRNLIIRSSDEKIGDKEYFINIYDNLLTNVNVIKTCYEYFKFIPDMDKFGKLQIPQTEYQNNLKQLSRSPIEQWLEAFTLKNHNKKEIELVASEACNMFKDWCEKNKITYEIDSNKFGVRLSNMNILGVKTGRKISTGRTKIYNIEELKSYFKLDCQIADDIYEKEEEEEEE